MKSDLLAFVMVTCIEGGSNHWAKSILPIREFEAPDSPWYAEPKFYASRGPLFTLTDVEGDEHEVTAEKVNAGFKEFARVYPKRAKRITENDGSADAEDTDILLQTIVYGELVYS